VEQQAEQTAGRGRRVWPVLAAVGAALVLLVVLAAFLPRWWAQRIADQSDSSMVQSIGVGLFYGFVFTLLPLALLWWGMRRASHWKTRFTLVAIALVLAMPNLLTLWIVVGRGNAAHAGDRTLDVEAPGFRGAVLVGTATAVVALVALIGLLRSRRRARERLHRLEAESRAEKGSPSAP
jgi:hypothetical protein